MFLHRQSSHLLRRGENLSFMSPTAEMLHGGLGGHLLCLAGQAESTAGTEDEHDACCPYHGSGAREGLAGESGRSAGGTCSGAWGTKMMVVDRGP